jgi:hypothetical protein
MTGFNTDFSSTDAAIDAYGTAGYKPLAIIVSGTSMGKNSDLFLMFLLYYRYTGGVL